MSDTFVYGVARRAARMENGVLVRLRARLAEPLNRTSFSLTASTLLTAALGLAFWALVARLYPAAVVGRDSALIAAMTAIAGITQLNLGQVIVRFLPQVRDRLGRRIFEAYAIAGGLSLLVAFGFVCIAPLVTGRFAFLGNDRILSLAFVVSVAACATFALQDMVLTALGRAVWLPIENGVFSATKLALLPLMVLMLPDHAAFVAWVLPMFATIPVINLLVARRLVPSVSRAQADAPGVVAALGWRRLSRFIAQDCAGAMVGQAIMIALPLLVLGLLGPEQSAYFYVPFMLVTTFDLVFQAVATSLTTEAARRPDRVGQLTRTAARRLLRVQLPAGILLCLAAPWVLAPFGAGYAHHGTLLLRLLALASCLRAVSFLYAATARLQGHGGRLLAIQLTSAALLIAASAALAPSLGLAGMGLAWLGAPAVIALFATPGLVRFLRCPAVAGVVPRREVAS